VCGWVIGGGVHIHMNVEVRKKIEKIEIRNVVRFD